MKQQEKPHSNTKVLLKESEPQTWWTQLAIRWASGLCNRVFHSFAFSHMSTTFVACQWLFVWDTHSLSKEIGLLSASNCTKSSCSMFISNKWSKLDHRMHIQENCISSQIQIGHLFMDNRHRAHPQWQTGQSQESVKSFCTVWMTMIYSLLYSLWHSHKNVDSILGMSRVAAGELLVSTLKQMEKCFESIQFFMAYSWGDNSCTIWHYMRG